MAPKAVVAAQTLICMPVGIVHLLGDHVTGIMQEAADVVLRGDETEIAQWSYDIVGPCRLPSLVENRGVIGVSASLVPAGGPFVVKLEHLYESIHVELTFA